VNYDPEVVARVFEELNADMFTCEYSIRAGTVDSLKLKPKLGTKVIALGIVNVVDPRVETVDEVSRKIEQAAQYVDIANLAVCNNCGFSGASVDAFFESDIQKQKLAVIVQTADRIWGTSSST
jgi:5-methyltetrahydropteroyltriglutamate--homocysteine methyltransferase